jgi:hypothetical protein
MKRKFSVDHALNAIFKNLIHCPTMAQTKMAMHHMDANNCRIWPKMFSD